MVDELESEFHVVDVQWGIGIALPLWSFFAALQGLVSTSSHSESGFASTNLADKWHALGIHRDALEAVACI
jgi:hypothetical protein